MMKLRLKTSVISESAIAVTKDHLAVFDWLVSKMRHLTSN